jgi:hypothetical protein
MLCLIPLLWLVVQLPTATTPAAGPATPLAAAQAFKRALEQSDLAALSELTAGPLATPLRSLGGPLAKARAAADRLETALKEKPALALTNPFAPSLQPFAGVRFEILEVVKERDQQLVRVRHAARAMPIREEELLLTADGANWRLQLPATLRQQVQELIGHPERLQREMEALEAIAAILNRLAEEIEKNRVQTKADAVARLLQLMHESKLSDLYEKP